MGLQTSKEENGIKIKPETRKWAEEMLDILEKFGFAWNSQEEYFAGIKRFQEGKSLASIFRQQQQFACRLSPAIDWKKDRTLQEDLVILAAFLLNKAEGE